MLQLEILFIFSLDLAEVKELIALDLQQEALEELTLLELVQEEQEEKLEDRSQDEKEQEA